MAAKALMIVPPQTTFEFFKSYNQTGTTRKKAKSATLTLKSHLKVKRMFKTKTKTWKRLSKSLMILKMTLKRKSTGVLIKTHGDPMTVRTSKTTLTTSR